MLHRNWIWLLACVAGCAVAVVPPPMVEGEIGARTALMLLRSSPAPEPTPSPKPDECCGQCQNGWITHGDGHRTPCPCPPTCKCKTASVQK